MVPRIIIGILFLVFAAVQYNDPDPWIWIMAYSLVGLICLWNINHSIVKPVLLGITTMFAISAAWYLPLMMSWVIDGMPSIIGEMKAATPHIEWMREFLGLMLCTFTLFWLSKSNYGTSQS